MSLGITERLRVVIDLDGAERMERQLDELSRAERGLGRSTRDLDAALRRQSRSFGAAGAQADRLGRDYNELGRSARRANEEISGRDGLASGIGGLGGVITIGVVAAAAKGMHSLGKLGAQAQDLDAAFRNLGGDSGTMQQARDVLRNTVDDMTIQRMFNLARAFQLSEQQFQGLLPVAKRMSQVMGLDMNEAVERLITGVGKLEVELLDELGIGFKLSDAYSDYAKTLGKTANQLSVVEQRTAAVVKVQQESMRVTKGMSLDAAADPYARLSASATNAAANVGKTTGIISSSMGLLADALDHVAQSASDESTLLAALGDPIVGDGTHPAAKAAEEIDRLTFKSSELVREQHRLKDAIKLAMSTDEIYALQDALAAVEGRQRATNREIISNLKAEQERFITAREAAERYGDSVAEDKVTARLNALTMQLYELEGASAFFGPVVEQWSPLVDNVGRAFDAAVAKANPLLTTARGIEKALYGSVSGAEGLVGAISSLARNVGAGISKTASPSSFEDQVQKQMGALTKARINKEAMEEARRRLGLPPTDAKRRTKSKKPPANTVAVAGPFSVYDGLIGEVLTREGQATQEILFQRRLRDLDIELQEDQRHRDAQLATQRRQHRDEQMGLGAGLAGQFGAFGGLFAEGPDQLNGFRDELGKTLDAMSMFAQTGNQAMMSFSQGIGQAVTSAIVDGERLDKAMGQMMGSVLVNTGQMMLGQAAAIAVFGAASAFFPILGLPAGASAGGAAAALAAGGVGAIAAGAALGGGGRGRGRGRTGRGGGAGGGGYGGGVPSIPRSRNREREFSPTFVIGINSEALTDEVITVSEMRRGEHGARYLAVRQEV